MAFWGRSNVGKSSLLNALVGQKIAKVSKTPGRTQLINLFEIEKPQAMICDLPGYGFAKLSKGQQKEISHMLENFFFHSEQIDLLCILLDARHGLTNTDKEILPLVASLQCPVHIILTKSDKNSNNVNQKVVRELKHDLAFHMIDAEISLTSSSSGKGLVPLVRHLTTYLDSED